MFEKRVKQSKGAKLANGVLSVFHSGKDFYNVLTGTTVSESAATIITLTEEIKSVQDLVGSLRMLIQEQNQEEIEINDPVWILAVKGMTQSINDLNEPLSGLRTWAQGAQATLRKLELNPSILKENEKTRKQAVKNAQKEIASTGILERALDKDMQDMKAADNLENMEFDNSKRTQQRALTMKQAGNIRRQNEVAFSQKHSKEVEKAHAEHQEIQKTWKEGKKKNKITISKPGRLSNVLNYAGTIGRTVARTKAKGRMSFNGKARDVSVPAQPPVPVAR
jgi:hypothetical protein